MFRPVSLEELKRSGFTIRADEALAVVQDLMHGPAPRGPATTATVCVRQDGSVACRGADTPLSVADAAALLQSLMPVGPSQVPAALRYAVARALQEVDAPPFESLDAFSSALARHERADRAEILRELVQRASRHAMSAPLFVERRRTAAPVAELRRQLRDADARLYDQQLALDALGAMVASGPSGRSYISRTLAISLTLAAGLVLAGAGDVMRARAGDDNAVRADTPPPIVRTTQTPEPPTASTGSAVAERSAPPDMPESPEQSKPAIKSAAPSVTRVRTTRPPQSRSRFQWLRSKIIFRSEPL